MLAALRLLIRLPLFFLHLLFGLLLEAFFRLIGGRLWYRRPLFGEIIKQWMKLSAFLLGLRIHVQGELCNKSTLLISNHISWLDIVAITSLYPITFVAKSDTKHWPLIGLLAKWSGTIFIDRQRRQAIRQAIVEMSLALKHDARVMFFPEGTTHRGEQLGPFHQALFQAAIDAQTAVQSIVINYRRNGQADYRLAPYVDDDHFILHLFQVMMADRIEVIVDFLPPISCECSDRRSLAERTHQQISARLSQHHAATCKPRTKQGLDAAPHYKTN